MIIGGLIHSNNQRQPSSNFYEVLKSIIQAHSGRSHEASRNFQEDLLRSIILQPPEVDWQINHHLVQNINMFVEVVLCEEVSDNILRGMESDSLLPVELSICSPDLATWTLATARRAPALGVNKDFDHNTLISLGANLLRFKRVSIHQVGPSTNSLTRLNSCRICLFASKMSSELRYSDPMCARKLSYCSVLLHHSTEGLRILGGQLIRFPESCLKVLMKY